MYRPITKLLLEVLVIAAVVASVLAFAPQSASALADGCATELDSCGDTGWHGSTGSGVEIGGGSGSSTSSFVGEILIPIPDIPGCYWLLNVTVNVLLDIQGYCNSDGSWQWFDSNGGYGWAWWR